jgi:serine protease Do
MLGGDLIVAVDGKPIEDPHDLSDVMNNHRAGDHVQVTIYRGQRRMNVELTLGEAQGQA